MSERYSRQTLFPPIGKAGQEKMGSKHVLMIGAGALGSGNAELLVRAGEMTEASAAWHIDHDYAMGTSLYFHVHWATASTDIGTVRWGFEYTIAKGHQQQAFPATSTVYIEQASTGIS